MRRDPVEEAVGNFFAAWVTASAGYFSVAEEGFSVRYPSPPTLRIGDRVRLANGRLERE